MFFQLPSSVPLLECVLLYLMQSVFTEAFNITLIPIGKKLEILTSTGRTTDSEADKISLLTSKASLDDLQQAVEKLLGKTNFGVLSGIPIPTMYPSHSLAVGSYNGHETTTTPVVPMDSDRGNFVHVDFKPSSVLTENSRLHFPSEFMQPMASNNVFNRYVPLTAVSGGHSPAQFSAGQPNYNPAQFLPVLERPSLIPSKLHAVVKPGLLSGLNITFSTSGQQKGADTSKTHIPVSASFAVPKLANSLDESLGIFSDSRVLNVQPFGITSTGIAKVPTSEPSAVEMKSESLILKNLLDNRPLSIIYDGGTALKPKVGIPNCNEMH